MVLTEKLGVVEPADQLKIHQARKADPENNADCASRAYCARYACLNIGSNAYTELHVLDMQDRL